MKFVKDKNWSRQIYFFHSKFHIVLSSIFFRKIIDTSLECCIDQSKSWNKWEKLLKILLRITKLQHFSMGLHLSLHTSHIALQSMRYVAICVVLSPVPKVCKPWYYLILLFFQICWSRRGTKKCIKRKVYNGSQNEGWN